MRKFVVKYTDSRAKQWLEPAVQQEVIVRGLNMPQAIRTFYEEFSQAEAEIKIKEIYELAANAHS